MFARSLVVLTALATPATAQQPEWLTRVQADDGRISAAAAGGADEQDLRATALVCLALLDSSTLRAGPERAVLRAAAGWLRRQVDAEGRIGHRAGPDWILDHAIATCALAEAARLSDTESLDATLRAAYAHLRQHLLVRRRGQVSSELLLWTAWAVRAHAADELTDELAEELLRQVERLRPMEVPATPRQRAAALLLGSLVPGGADAEALAQPFGDGWPLDLDDPLTVYFAGAALYRGAGHDHAAWRAFAKRVQPLVVDTQEMQGAWAGTWAARGDEDRICTTAVMHLVLTVYYRYSRLLPAR